MAMGNDGNYLQHSIEVSAAHALLDKSSARRLHVALAHGMAPYEPLDPPRPPREFRRLRDALGAAAQPPKADESHIVRAFRDTWARTTHYPNSGELLRSVVGTDQLSGGITEICDQKYRALANWWNGTGIEPVCASWRDQLEPGQTLACPTGLDRPWLFTMDPMTYSEHGTQQANLNGEDIDRLEYVLTPYVKSRQPGIALLPVYAVPEDVQPEFWRFVAELSHRIGARYHRYSIAHNGAQLNLACVLYSGFDLDPEFAPPELCRELNDPGASRKRRHPEMGSDSLMPHPEATVYGVDGCPAGWFFIRLGSDGKIVGDVAERFEAIVNEAGDSDRIFVDIPIGLPKGVERRPCDVEARRVMRGSDRVNSVFTTPSRGVLRAETFEEANRISWEIAARGVSRQTWGIIPKIREMDKLIRNSPKALNIVREVHPEICFWALAGGKPMSHSKKKRAGGKNIGIEERLDVLKCFRPTIRDDYRKIRQKFYLGHVARDDILDAMAAAITAQAPDACRTLPERPPVDACGLRMEMVYRKLATPKAKKTEY